jgi:hypothetical protein
MEVVSSGFGPFSISPHSGTRALKPSVGEGDYVVLLLLPLLIEIRRRKGVKTWDCGTVTFHQAEMDGAGAGRAVVLAFVELELHMGVARVCHCEGVVISV